MTATKTTTIKVSLDDAARTVWTFDNATAHYDQFGATLVIRTSTGGRQFFPLQHVLWWSEAA